MKKILKRIMSTILTVAMLVVFLFETNVSANQEPSTSTYDPNELIGFTVKRTCVVKYNCDQPYISAPISNEQIVGYCDFYIGRYRRNVKVDGAYYDGAIVKCNMKPNVFQNTKGKKYYGFSQYLEISSQLPSHCIYQGNTPITDTSGSDGYSFGIDASGVSGQISINKKYCIVSDNSFPHYNKWNISYDYKVNAFDLNKNSARNKAVFDSTWQMATCEWRTDKYDYYNSIKIYAKFGVATNKCGFAALDPLANFSSSYTHTVSDSWKH